MSSGRPVKDPDQEAVYSPSAREGTGGKAEGMKLW